MANRFFRVLPVCLLAAALAACEGAGPGSSAPPQSASAPSAPAPWPEPTPEPEPVYRASVLTGLPVPAGEVPGTRVAAVVVDNMACSRPQSGLGAAQVLYELPVEGGITRFLALFEDYAAMPEVGPVRSSRDGFLQLAMPLQPLFVCEGGGTMHSWYAGEFKLWEYLLDGTGSRVATHRAEGDGLTFEQTAYTNGALVGAAVAAASVDDARAYKSTLFEFAGNDEMARTPAGGPASAVEVVFSESYRSIFAYEPGRNRYLMRQWNSTLGEEAPTVDKNNDEQLAFTNVLVLFAEMPAYPGTQGELLDIQFGFGGVGYYFSYGGAERIRWAKESPMHALRLVAFEDGVTPVRLNPGTSYVAVADVERAGEFGFGARGRLTRLAGPEDASGAE